MALGHIIVKTSHAQATIELFLELGFRSIVTRENFAVLEMRGGSHLVIRGVDVSEQPETIDWDIMVDDLDGTHAAYSPKGPCAPN